MKTKQKEKRKKEEKKRKEAKTKKFSLESNPGPPMNRAIALLLGYVEHTS